MLIAIKTVLVAIFGIASITGIVLTIDAWCGMKLLAYIVAHL